MLPSKTLASLLLPLAAVGASAMEGATVGPRALGMGGTGVACSDDYVAQYYNPAAFGFFGYTDADGARVPSDNNDLARKRWGWGIADATVGAHVIGNLGQYLNDVLEVDVDKLQNLGQTGSDDTKVLNDAVTALAALSSFDPGRDAVLADFNAGAGLRIGHFGIGVRVFGQALGQLDDLDTTHIGVELPPGKSVLDQINEINTTVPSGYTPTKLSSQQQATLTTILQNSDPGATQPEIDQAIAKLDISLNDAGIPDAAVDGVIAQLDTLVNSSIGGLTFGQNQTKLKMVGLAVAEIPVTYGYAFDDHWSIGGSVKYMIGRVYGLSIPLFNTSDGKEFSDYLSDAREDYRVSTNVGVDLGVMARWSMLQVGVTGRNLNGPLFRAPNGFKDQRLDPSVTAGLAFIPFDTLTLAADADLSRLESVLPGREYQHVGAGVEWNILHAVALRGGVSKNIAESDDPTLFSAGLGINLWLVRIDLAGQATADTIDYDGNDVPKEARASLAVATDW